MLRLSDAVVRVVCSKTKRVAYERPAIVLGVVPPNPPITKPLGLCACCAAPGSPLVVEYDGRARAFVDRPGLARYGAYLPIDGVPDDYLADVGQTPTVQHSSLSDALDVEVHLKLEGGNPSGSFKDRGLSIGVALGRALGAKSVCLPTQGNAGVAASLFSARLGIPCLAYMPLRHEGSIYHRAAAHFGADVRFFGANIAEAGAEMRRVYSAQISAGEILDVSTFWEPGRLEGKKTMGLEIAEHFGERLPEWILYPTGGGTGLVGIVKAFAELGLPSPRMVAVQSTKCPPVVRAFERGLDHVEKVVSEGTIADGLDVPGAIMGHGILDAIRSTNGTAIAVTDEAIVSDFRALGRAGVSSSYEGGATLAALRALRDAKTIAKGSRVLLLVTAGHAVAL